MSSVRGAALPCPSTTCEAAKRGEAAAVTRRSVGNCLSAGGEVNVPEVSP